ncbi:glutathione S-transferase theta-1-like [Pristis pectinata]|uniref:glutathione S-transferase theta-1-like n=1 Tax=Pristis pectinata TaxID=685728 RepID=UPI00223D9F8D|nr:glutathione S-transferase theta-1-like [Pristis pectinata]
MALQLYGDLNSQPSRSVYIFLKKNNIPFEYKEVRLFMGEQYSEEYQKINPLGKVPVIKDGDFVLAESVAILKYLAGKYRTPEHWYPTELQQRARVDEYLAWQHFSLRPQAAKVFMIKGLVPVVAGRPEPEASVKEAVDELNQSLEKFQQKFLQDKPFVVGAEISLADLVAIVELMQPLGAGYDPLDGRTPLMAWRERVKAAVGQGLFDEVHAPVLNTQQSLQWITQNQPALFEGLKKIILKKGK